MESIAAVLGRYNPQEPDEVLAVKKYIADEFKAEASVGLRGETIVVTVTSASLANALRLKLPAIRAAAKTKKRLMFRIG
jgi:hypothetical protein